ncbi:hypothetical protein F7R12_24845 [Pseudomonas tolaasii]|nr:hypothetical protein F7R12_24845 [Pseudomonas tolaasii]
MKETPPFSNSPHYPVGASLPAMRTTRYIRHTRLMPSQASQLPHLISNAREVSVSRQRLNRVQPRRIPGGYKPEHNADQRRAGKCRDDRAQ